MTSPFEKTDTWVETGPDGHHFYVKKKQPSGLPSFKAIFREAAHDIWHGSSPFWKEFKKANKKRSKSNPTLGSQTPNIPYPYTTSHTSLHVPAMQSNQENGNNTNNQPRGILKPEPQRFAGGANGGPPLAGWIPMLQPPSQPQPPAQPFPNVYPGALASYGSYGPQMGYGYNQTAMQTAMQNAMQTHLSNPNLPPGPTQPPGGFQGPALSSGARAISPPRFPTQDELKYKCAVCGRFRSASYHYRHPLAPGQLPGTTVCRKCRNTATDSEDESVESEDSLRSERHGRRHAPRSHRTIPRRAHSRGRSRSRIRSLSRSSSVDQIRPGRSRSVVVRRRSPRRVVYVEEDSEYLSGGEDEEVEIRTIRRMPRTATPGIRRSTSQYSDPGLGFEYAQDHRRPFEDRTPRRHVSRSRPPTSRHGSYQSYSSDMDRDWYAPDPPPAVGPSTRRRRGSVGHYRRPSSAPYPDSDEERGALVHDHDDTRSMGSTRSSRRNLPRPEGFAQRVRENVQPVDQRSSSDDYDWYDREGMRVRVREI